MHDIFQRYLEGDRRLLDAPVVEDPGVDFAQSAQGGAVAPDLCCPSRDEALVVCGGELIIKTQL